MKKTTKHTHPTDAFDDIFKSKLSDYQLPVDNDSWLEIEKRLQKKDKRKIPFWFWIPMGSAALIALLFSILPFSNTNNINSVSHATKFIKSDIKLGTAVTKPACHYIAIQSHLNSKKVLQRAHVSTDNQAIKERRNEDKEIVISTSTSLSESIKNQSITADSSNLAVAAGRNTETDQTETDIAKRTTLQDVKTKSDWELPKKIKEKSWLLAASFGTSGSAMMTNGGNELMLDAVNNGYLTNADLVNSVKLAPSDFSEKNYIAPLSFGINISKQLTNRLSIETGLFYTYLLSTFKNNDVQQKEAKLHLHYIGIPVNLILNLWQNPKWEIYVSGGGAVEKGLQSVYIQKIYYSNSEYTTTAKTGIDGLQWSLNGAIGVGYKINKRFSLYLEPKLSYFFDNNQPVSARTDQAISLGFAAGLKIGL